MDFPTMPEIFWWVLSVIVVGILINLMSDYLKPTLDRLIAQRSEAKRRANEAQRQQFEQEVQKLLSDKSAVVDLKLDLLNYNLRAITTGVLGVLIMQALFAIPAAGFALTSSLVGTWSGDFLNFLFNLPIVVTTFLTFVFLRGHLSNARKAGRLLSAHRKRQPVNETTTVPHVNAT